MKQGVIFLGIIALFASSCKPLDKKAQEQMTKKEAALAVIHSRKSVREYIPGKEISKEDLEVLVRAGMSAPTARDMRPWHFVVITDRSVLDSLAQGLPYAKMLSQASAAIVVCGDTTIRKGDFSHWVVDCSAATENILLAVEAMGLGGVWTAAYPYADRTQVVTKALKLPENILPLNVIPVGYPAKEEQPKDKYNAERVHWNQF